MISMRCAKGCRNDLNKFYTLYLRKGLRLRQICNSSVSFCSHSMSSGLLHFLHSSHTQITHTLSFFPWSSLLYHINIRIRPSTNAVLCTRARTHISLTSFKMQFPTFKPEIPVCNNLSFCAAKKKDRIEIKSHIFLPLAKEMSFNVLCAMCVCKRHPCEETERIAVKSCATLLIFIFRFS